MEVFTFDVGVSTHGLLREGVTVRHHTRVTVASEDFLSAQLMACQMAACGGWMPTEVSYME